jgi:signal transduction histidine kinase
MRLALSIGAATLVPIVALIWLGVRVLRQEERERASERLDVAARRLALDIERQLQDVEDRLSRGTGIRLLPSGLDARTDGAGIILYQPLLIDVPAPVSSDLNAAEMREFQQRDLQGAAVSYRRLTGETHSALRAAGLVRLARVLRQQGDREGALRAYADLEAMGDVNVDGQPAALVGLQGRAKVLEKTGDTRGLHETVERLAAALNAGTWRIDRATFGLYREMLDRWHLAPTPADAVIRTEAALEIWQTWRAGTLPFRGRRVVRTNNGSAIAAWAADSSSPRLWLIGAAAFEAQMAPLWTSKGLRVSGFDIDGAPLFGRTPAGEGLSLTTAETRLPFVVAVAAGPAAAGAERSRHLLIVGGLAGVLLLIVAAAYGLYRATSRELMLARQQSDFVSAVSHEFRTPLTSMRHLTELLVTRSVTSEERRTQYYQLLAHETERLYRMVETLLSFGRMEAGAYAFELEPVDPSELIRSVVDEFRTEPLARGREIVCDVAAALPPIQADRETLTRALWNLLENAAKYSKPGTPIRVFSTLHGHAVLIGIGDRGMGISPAER